MKPFSTPISMLVCEDDEMALQLLHTILSMNYSGVTIHAATNGRTGLDCFREHLPDIIITDINMPDMSGLDMALEIQSIRADVKTIVITAHESMTVAASTARLGVSVDHCCHKPLVYKDLFSAIDNCIACITEERSCGRAAGAGL